MKQYSADSNYGWRLVNEMSHRTCGRFPTVSMRSLEVSFPFPSVNTLRTRQNDRHFPDDIFKCIFGNHNAWISIKVSLTFGPKGPINNFPALVHIKDWRRTGDKPILGRELGPSGVSPNERSRWKLAFSPLNMFNLRLCNAAIIRYSLLKFGRMHLCGKDYKYFSPHCCKCNSFGCIVAIRCGNSCYGPHSDSVYSGSEHR